MNAKKILIFNWLFFQRCRIFVNGSVNLLVCTNVTSVVVDKMRWYQYLASTLIFMNVQVMVGKMPLVGIAGFQVNHEIVVGCRCGR